MTHDSTPPQRRLHGLTMRKKLWLDSMDSKRVLELPVRLALAEATMATALLAVTVTRVPVHHVIT